MNIVEKLQLYGVGVSLLDGDIKLSGLPGVPPGDRAAVDDLIKQIKASKAEVTEMLQQGIPPPPEPPKPRNIKPRLLTVGDEMLLKVCKQQQEYIKQSEAVRGNICKGLNNGESLESLFLDAVKCISLMTGDTVVYKIAERQLGTQEVTQCPT